MPAYDIECKDCKNIWEIFHSIKEDPIYICPKCSSNNCDKKFLPIRTLNKDNNAYDYNDVRDSGAKNITDKHGRKYKYDPSKHGYGIKGSN